jgi:hypothetical protein
MHKSATKCNETLSKWCKNKHGASKIMDTLEMYQPPRVEGTPASPHSDSSPGPQGKRLLADIYEETEPGETEFSGLCLFGLEEPSDHIEALKNSCWKNAMQEELTAIEENRTWKLCDLLRGHRPIGLKWVYKLKKNPSGEVFKHKARLVATKVMCRDKA